jgi:hypothetical protein
MKKNKFHLVKIIRSKWNCTITINYVGKEGAVTSKELGSVHDVKTVMIGKESVNFHLSELQIIN